jgi:hypothetical protein
MLQILVAAGGKWGNVGLWDAQDTGGPQNGVHLYVAHRYLNSILYRYLTNVQNRSKTTGT